MHEYRPFTQPQALSAIPWQPLAAAHMADSAGLARRAIHPSAISNDALHDEQPVDVQSVLSMKSNVLFAPAPPAALELLFCMPVPAQGIALAGHGTTGYASTPHT